MIKQNKRVTLTQIAKEVGVSVGVVSVVLNGRTDSVIGVRPAVADKIKKVAKTLNYKPNAAARMMVSQQTKLVGVIIPNKPGREGQSPMSYETILGIEDALQSKGYVLVLVRMHDLFNKDNVESRVFSENTLDGVIVIDAMGQDEVSWIKNHFAVKIWCDSNEWHTFGCVRRNEYEVGQIVANHLIEKGFKSFRLVGSEPPAEKHYSLVQRREGIENVAKEMGVKSEFHNIYDEAKGIHYDHQIFKDIDKNTALIAITHSVAEALILAACGFSLIAGRDFSLMSCDDPHALSWRWGHLTRVSFDRYSMGKTAADMIIKQLSIKKPVPSSLQSGDVIPGTTIIS